MQKVVDLQWLIHVTRKENENADVWALKSQEQLQIGRTSNQEKTWFWTASRWDTGNLIRWQAGCSHNTPHWRFAKKNLKRLKSNGLAGKITGNHWFLPSSMTGVPVKIVPSSKFVINPKHLPTSGSTIHFMVCFQNSNAWFGFPRLICPTWLGASLEMQAHPHSNWIHFYIYIYTHM